MQVFDRDTATVMAALRAAVAESGMSQGEFARAVGTSGSRFSTYLTGHTRPSAWFLLRAQRIARSLALASGRRLMSAPATSAAMRVSLASGEVEWVWRMLLQGRDHLRLILAGSTTGSETDEDLLGAWEAAPESTGEPRWDALLAALTRREFEEAGLPAPAWTLVDALDDPWVMPHPFLSPERVRTQTPAWLRELNIFVPQRDLVTA